MATQKKGVKRKAVKGKRGRKRSYSSLTEYQALVLESQFIDSENESQSYLSQEETLELEMDKEEDVYATPKENTNAKTGKALPISPEPEANKEVGKKALVERQLTSLPKDKKAQRGPSEQLSMQLATKESLQAVTPTPVQTTQKDRQTAKDLSVMVLEKMEKLVREVKDLKNEVASLKRTIKELLGQPPAKKRSEGTKRETMASRLASLSSTNQTLPSKSAKVKEASQVKNKNSLILDLSQCPTNVNERPISDIRSHLQVCLKAKEETKEVVICGMKRDSRIDHRYFLYFELASEETTARIHSTWLNTDFSKAHILSPTTFPIKVNGAKALVILDSQSGRVSDIAKKNLSDENGGLAIARIGWLSRQDKSYGSMVISFSQKADADRYLQKGLIEVEGESAYTAEWKKMKIQDQRCFNCQKQGHLAVSCREETRCGNCGQHSHRHRDCINVYQKCAICNGPHRANSTQCAGNKHQNNCFLKDLSK